MASETNATRIEPPVQPPAERDPLPDPEQMNRRVVALGQEALEGRRPLSDVLGEALRELRLAVQGARAMEAELRRREEVIAALRETGPALAPTAAEVEAVLAEEPPAGAGNGGAAAPTRVAGPSPAPLVEESRPETPADLFGRPVPAGMEALEEALRRRIAGALFLGTLGPGDRLPSIRELARRTGLNHKTVRRMYRELERSGLVEVRDRSGIYVAEPDARPGGAADPVDGWLAEVVVEGVGRGVSAADLPAVLRRAVGERPLRCACVDSTEDDRFALCREIEGRFGVRTLAVEAGRHGLAERLRGADLVVTTPFHAEEVRRARAPGQPVVVACLHSALWRAMRGDGGGHPVTVVCVEQASVERLREGLPPEDAARVRAARVDAPGGADGGGTVLTLAARARLDGSTPPGALVPPYLSVRTVRQLARLLVGLNRSSPGAN